MFQTKAKVIKNIEVTKNYYKIALSSSWIAQAAKPGQFLQVRVADNYEPLLRRPFSIHRVGYRLSVIGYRPQTAKPGKPNTIEILYEVVGKGTQILSQKKRGEYLDIIGPLGNGFDYKSPLDFARGRQVTPRLRSGQAGHPSTSLGAGRSQVLVAGGMGVAPLMFLAEKITGHKVTKSVRSEAQPPRRGQSHKLKVLIGAKSKDQILCEKEFQRLGCEVKIATDDGSRGFKGKVTDLLKKILVTGHPSTSSFSKLRTSLGASKSQVTGQKLATCDLRLATIYACGPRPMLKEISRISKEYKIPAQISLEEHMACGIGACLGCVVKTQYSIPACRQARRNTQYRFQYKRVCKEGPVFDSQEVIW